MIFRRPLPPLAALFPPHPIPRLTPYPAPQEHSFLHDPNKMDPSAKGSKTTSLRWTPAPDGKAYFVTAAQGGSVQGAAKSSVTVTLSKADCYVFEKVRRRRARQRGRGSRGGGVFERRADCPAAPVCYDRNSLQAAKRLA